MPGGLSSWKTWAMLGEFVTQKDELGLVIRRGHARERQQMFPVHSEMPFDPFSYLCSPILVMAFHSATSCYTHVPTQIVGSFVSQEDNLKAEVPFHSWRSSSWLLMLWFTFMTPWFLIPGLLRIWGAQNTLVWVLIFWTPNLSLTVRKWLLPDLWPWLGTSWHPSLLLCCLQTC